MIAAEPSSYQSSVSRLCVYGVELHSREMVRSDAFALDLALGHITPLVNTNAG